MGCRKDVVPLDPSVSTGSVVPQAAISIDAAKRWFDNVRQQSTTTSSSLNQRLRKVMNPSDEGVSVREQMARVEAFIDISTDIEAQLTQLAQQDRTFITSGGDINILMRIFGKVLSKKIGKVIPFVGTALGAEEVWTAYNIGNYGEAAFALAGIAMDFIPMGIVLETGWTIVDVAYHTFKAYKPIAKFIDFAGDSRVLNAIIDVLDDINLWNNFSWLNNTDGIRVVGANKILSFWDKLISKFPDKVFNPGNPNEIKYNLFANVYVKMYLVSTTPPNYLPVRCLSNQRPRLLS